MTNTNKFKTSMDIQEIFLNAIKNINPLDNPLGAYDAFLKTFESLNYSFPKITLPKGTKLFRVRPHKENDPHLYTYESQLSYRKDFENIKFGRCNKQGQSLFYCSNNPSISFAEVSELIRTLNKPIEAFHTTGVWELMEDVTISFVFDPSNINETNAVFVSLKNDFYAFLNNIQKPPLFYKENLTDFISFISDSFTKPSADFKNVYLFSSAFTNYVLKTVGQNFEKVEGLLYPTCLTAENLKNKGVNFVFNTELIGFGKKIELVDIYKSKMSLSGLEYYETERQEHKSINKESGEIFWN